MLVEKVANVEDQAKGAVFEVFRTNKLSGDTCLLQVERGKTFGREALYRELVKANVDMPSNRRAALEQLDEVIAQEPPERWVYSAAGGWRDGEAAFLLGKKLIGDAAGIRVFPPGGPDAPRRIVLLRRGNLARWQRVVATPALAFPPWVAGLSAAFAAPLLARLGWPAFRLHLFGGTELRRTATVVMAGSAVGLAQGHIAQLSKLVVGQVPNLAPLLTDLAVPLIDPDAGVEGAARACPSEIAKKFLSHGARGYVPLFVADPEAWRGVVVSAASTATDPPSTASALRPATTIPFTLDLPVSLSAWGPSDLAAADGVASRRLLRACDHDGGFAFRAYIKFLVSCYPDLREMATKSVADFRDAAGKTDREMAKSPLLTGYARLYAGGAMAIAAGVVPWKPQQLAAALIACLKVAHQHACQNVVSLTTLRQQLRQHLQKVELGTHHARAGGSDPKVGFCRVEGGERVLTIHGKTFRGWFANRRQRVAVLRWLHDAGHLRMGERRCQPSSSSTQWAERSVRWPDGRVHRSYVFRDPFLPAPTAVARIGRQRR